MAFQMDIDSCCLAELPGSSKLQESGLHACEISVAGSGVSLRYDVMSGEESSIHMRGSNAT